jgi:hypothetical protein
VRSHGPQGPLRARAPLRAGCLPDSPCACTPACHRRGVWSRRRVPDYPCQARLTRTGSQHVFLASMSTDATGGIDLNATCRRRCSRRRCAAGSRAGAPVWPEGAAHALRRELDFTQRRVVLTTLASVIAQLLKRVHGHMPEQPPEVRPRWKKGATARVVDAEGDLQLRGPRPRAHVLGATCDRWRHARAAFLSPFFVPADELARARRCVPLRPHAHLRRP